MPRILETTVYTFEELSEAAQEKAIERYREADSLDYQWWDFVYENVKCLGALIGIEIDRIYFSGFWSQGDGACFEGSYSYKKGGVKALKNEAPHEEELHKIATDLQEIQRRAFYALSANVKHQGHYQHEFCTSISVDDARRWNASEEDEEGISEALRDFMRWIYSRLASEYEYLTSDEVIRETLISNEYEFDKEGGLV
jgi:hypothetical protein